MSVAEMDTPMTDEQPPVKASFLRVLKDQRKIMLVALAMIVASYWFAGQFGELRLAGCISAGVLIGLAIFRLIALVMTTIPLLKELKNQ